MKKKSPIHAYKRLLAKDQDWDYAYLIALEKKKLQRMHDYFKHEGHFELKQQAVRDIAICIVTLTLERRVVNHSSLKHTEALLPSPKFCSFFHHLYQLY